MPVVICPVSYLCLYFPIFRRCRTDVHQNNTRIRVLLSYSTSRRSRRQGIKERRLRRGACNVRNACECFQNCNQEEQLAIIGSTLICKNHVINHTDVSTDTDTRTCTCICAGFWEFYAADLKSWSKESVPNDQVGKRITDRPKPSDMWDAFSTQDTLVVRKWYQHLNLKFQQGPSYRCCTHEWSRFRNFTQRTPAFQYQISPALLYPVQQMQSCTIGKLKKKLRHK